MRRIIATSPDPALNWAILDYLDATLNWRERWDDFDAMDATSWPDTIERAHDLNAFAFCGMLPGWSLPDADVQADQFTDVPGHIRRSIELLNGFVGLLPNAREFYGIASLQRTCLAAEARLKIDDGAALTVHELAAVTKVTTKRLQNAIYAKTEDAPIPGKDGLIASESAARWLKAREYLPSIWQEFIAGRCWEADGSEELNPCEEPSRENTERYFFVPEARDGTIFSPTACRRPQVGYTVGSKGAEKHFDDYAEALAALVAMHKPHWRRPNENGIFGTVSAERWRRLSQTELNAL